MAAGNTVHLAKSWENVGLVRQRFRRQVTWLQWPVPNPDSDLEDLHAPNTRALELNAEILHAMCVELQGFSIDVKTLELEAHGIVVLTCVSV